MAITKNEFYRKLEIFAEGYGDSEIKIDRGHAQVILENKKAALKAASKQSKTIEKLLKTQGDDQAKVFCQEQEIAKLKLQLEHAVLSRDNAIANGLRIQKEQVPKMENVIGYDQNGKSY